MINEYIFKNGKLVNDHFQNFKSYGIPHAQLIIADVPCFTIGVDVRRPAYVVWSKNQLAVHYDIKFNYWKSSLFRTLCKIV